MKNSDDSKKRNYREKKQHGQGYDLEPKSHNEIKSQKNKNPLAKESDEESRLSGSKSQQYFKDQHGLGSPLNYDDYSDESFP